MSHELLSSRAWVVASVVISLASLQVAAQTPTTVKKATAAKDSSKKAWTLQRTPDGQADLQGMWTNGTITPFERPSDLAGKQFLTEEEAADLEKETAAQRAVEHPPNEGETGGYNQVWFDWGSKVVSTKQTSLVVYPPDGMVPVRPEALEKRDYYLAHHADSYEYQNPWERCITRGVPGGMFPEGYNGGYQILQTPGYFVIISEMIHDARIIPLDGRPHLGQNMRFWDGDPRGHWEGNTLVVDTTNYNDKGTVTTVIGPTARIKAIPQSEALHVVEHFTRVDENTLNYEVTIDDPNVYTSLWKVALPLSRDPNYQIYEYACHEGNYAMVDVLRGGRAKDKADEDAEKKKSK
jgi:hypothetical protein